MVKRIGTGANETLLDSIGTDILHGGAAGKRLMLTNSAEYFRFADVLVASRTEGHDTIISLYGVIEIVLKDVSVDEPTAQNFTFWGRPKVSKARPTTMCQSWRAGRQSLFRRSPW